MTTTRRSNLVIAITGAAGVLGQAVCGAAQGAVAAWLAFSPSKTVSRDTID